MNWQIEKAAYKVYPRNPLKSVVCELRFQPILSISSPDKVADFQERIRATFPEYSEGQIQQVTLRHPNQIEAKQDRVFAFSKADGGSMVRLGPTNVVLESTSHERRDDFLKELGIALDALDSVYAPLNTTRLGLRYINIVDREQISMQLGKECNWTSLIRAEYLAIPAGITDLEDTLFANEIRSPMGNGGMTLRYGLFRNSPKEARRFRFDMDRYIDGETPTDRVVDSLMEFTDNIFSLFKTLPEQDLLAWMSAPTVHEPAEGVH